MYLRSLLFVLAIFSVGLINAQLPDGSIAPDFTITDLNGEQYQLYPYLESGKSVILDFSATWCGICWNYHNSHAIEDAYTTYGPDGMDIAMAFFIEADANTNDACVTGSSGCSTSSIGDWTDGVTHPVINLTGDELSVKSDYDVSGFPTIIGIAPNKKMYETGRINADEWTSWLTETFALEGSAVINNNMIDLTVNGGFETITYEWNNGETTEDLSGLDPGIYSVTVTEGRGHSIEIMDLEIVGSNLSMSCPTDKVTICSSDEAFIYPSVHSFEEFGGIIGGDFDASSFTIVSESTDGNTCPETVTRTYSISDMNGFTVECSHNIVVMDDIAPDFAAPEDMIVNELPEVYLTLSAYIADGGSASDNCAIDELSFILLAEQTDNQPCATVTRTYLISDLCGNTSTAAQILLVGLGDEASAEFSFSNSGLEYDFVSDANFGDHFEWTFDGVIFSTDENPSFTFDAPGIYEVCFTSSSICETLTSCQDLNATIDGVTVNFTCPAQTNNLCSINELPAFTNLTEYQEAGGNITGDYDPNSFELIDESSDEESCPETIFRTYRILDINGQAYGCQHIITVNDDEGPEITSPGSIIVASLGDQVYNSIDDLIQAGGMVTDNCALDEYGFALLSQINNDSDPCNFLSRVYLASDICGNTSTVEQIVYVELSDNAQLSFLATQAELNVDFAVESNFGITYEWTFGDGNTSTEENPSHIYSEEGVYEVCVTAISPCGSQTTCSDITVLTSNTNDFEANAKLISVSPNPAKDFINVEIELGVQIDKIELISIEGRTMNISISNNHLQSLEIRDLNAGMYLLRVQSGGAFLYKKVMVQ